MTFESLIDDRNASCKTHRMYVVFATYINDNESDKRFQG